MWPCRCTLHNASARSFCSPANRARISSLVYSPACTTSRASWDHARRVISICTSNICLRRTICFEPHSCLFILRASFARTPMHNATWCGTLPCASNSDVPPATRRALLKCLGILGYCLMPRTVCMVLRMAKGTSELAASARSANALQAAGHLDELDVLPLGRVACGHATPKTWTSLRPCHHRIPSPPVGSHARRRVRGQVVLDTGARWPGAIKEVVHRHRCLIRTPAHHAAHLLYGVHGTGTPPAAQQHAGVNFRRVNTRVEDLGRYEHRAAVGRAEGSQCAGPQRLGVLAAQPGHPHVALPQCPFERRAVGQVAAQHQHLVVVAHQLQ